VSKPLYYIVMFGKWRSMRPPVWKSFCETMRAFLEKRVMEPHFEDYGKEVYGRPSRVKQETGHQGKPVYWTEEKHLLIRAPEDWKLEDWKFEALDAACLCKPSEVETGPDIFDLILQK
jgi:hypothetical protein